MTNHRPTRSTVHHDQIHPLAQSMGGGQSAACAVQVSNLVPIHALLGAAEAVARGAAHLDENQLRRRTGIDCQDVDLVAADNNVASEEAPASLDEMCRDLILGATACLLARGLHHGHGTRGPLPGAYQAG